MAIIKSKSARLLDKTRKELHKIFEQFDLKITAEVNLNVVNFLDVTFDLNNAKHKPYRKPNDDPLYINRHSNHPPSITRQLPTAINKRIALSHRTNKHLRNLRLFTRTLLDLVTLITNSRTLRMHLNGHVGTHHLVRMLTRMFNPPFSKNVNTNIGREILSLIDKHFPVQHKLHKIFNRNTLKISYSCMINVKSIITKHNAHIIRNSQSQNTETDNCNCDNKNTCPLPKQC